MAVGLVLLWSRAQREGRSWAAVTQFCDDRLHWVAEIAGVKREWYAKVLEQVPDQKVA